MSKDIVLNLKEATKGLLSDESLEVIKESLTQAVNEKVSIHVEKALTEQDEQYTQKLEQLLEAIDTDHTRKLTRVVEAIDLNNTGKLKQVVTKYSNALTSQADDFKSTLIEQISNYLDLYLEKTFPQQSINEAVKNNKAKIVLENLRKSLAVDTTLMKESVKDAIIDGKQQLDEALNSKSTLENKVAELNKQLAKVQAELVFEQKTSTLPENKKAYARKVLTGKSPQFITENLEYTLGLFDKTEEERLVALKEEAFDNHDVKDVAVVEESAEQQTSYATPFLNTYINELGKY